MVSESSGFTGPCMFAELFYGFPHIIAWIVIWILPNEHFETRTPEDFITITKQSPYTFNGISDNYRSLKFSPVFLQREEKEMDNW